MSSSPSREHSVDHEENSTASDVGAVTGYTFTKSQLDFMRDRVDAYVGTASKKRRRFFKRICDHLGQKIEKERGKPMLQSEEKKLLQGIRTWFKAQTKTTRKSKDDYSTNWYPRLVYMKSKRRRTKAMAKRMLKGDWDVDRFLEEYDSDAAPGTYGSDDDDVPKRKGRKGGEGDWFFNYYQDAARELMSRLSESQHAHYETLAAKWNATGPPPKIQAENADKKASKKAYDWAKDMDKDFNCISMTFLGWRRANGRPIAILSEFNKDFGRSTDFSERNRDDVQALFREFRNYVYDEFDTKPTDSDEEEVRLPADTRGSKKPLIPMVRNSYGEPILPNPNTRPRNVREHDWYTDILRSFFIYHYQLSGNFKTVDSFRFPWTQLAANRRAFISEEVMPQNIVDHIKEPSSMRLGPKKEVFNYLYDLQSEARVDEEAADELLFELHAYLDPKDNILPRNPRKRQGDVTGDQHEYTVLGGDSKDGAGGKRGKKKEPERKKGSKEKAAGGKVDKTAGSRKKKAPRLSDEEEAISTDGSEESDSFSMRTDSGDSDLASEGDYDDPHYEGDSEETDSEESESEDDNEEDEDEEDGEAEGTGFQRRDMPEKFVFDYRSSSESEEEGQRSKRGGIQPDEESTAPEAENSSESGEDDLAQAAVTERQSSKKRASKKGSNSKESADGRASGESAVDEKVSSFKGVRTRKQKEMAERGLTLPPESASQIGRKRKRRGTTSEAPEKRDRRPKRAKEIQQEPTDRGKRATSGGTDRPREVQKAQGEANTVGGKKTKVPPATPIKRSQRLASQTPQRITRASAKSPVKQKGRR
ncbi:hypothetical protein CC1G_10773 [Coprinopsis cinerea okayama7|uniref:Uncharacterized protein n=1 Tax=Coprinopsis cinerea (strain Okayama-7 / 130 / ATCC MYA-4618 / FGSC 9003) TaxID=240176 RepID=A8P3E0_COPC7|nr:hypothetical protein CC1G_10773 [Coprinopsis cinerea okayama7\|eukprot:XP_001838531.1 hypothetical protein CC1G_10773 [Coprinopsis cinerea okayama7\